MAVNLEAKLSLRSRGFTQKVDQAKLSVGGLAKSFTGLKGIIGAGLALGGITAGVKSLTDLADEVDNLSTRMGIGAEKTQLLKIAAEENGQSVEVVSDAFKTLIVRSQEALAGNEKIKDGFEALGLTMEMLATGDIEVMFDQLNKALTESPNRIEATAQGMMLLGEPIEKLVPILNTFNNSLDTAVSEETIKNVDKFGDQFGRFGRNIKNMSMEMLGFFSKVHEKIAISPLNMADAMRKSNLELTKALKGGSGEMDAKSMADVAKRKKEMEDAAQAEKERKEKELEIAKAAAELDKISRANMLDQLSDEEKLVELKKEQNKLLEEANQLSYAGQEIEMYKKLTAAEALDKNIRGLNKEDSKGDSSMSITKSAMQQAGAMVPMFNRRLTQIHTKQLSTQEEILRYTELMYKKAGYDIGDGSPYGGR